jgi:hypothetical protein
MRWSAEILPGLPGTGPYPVQFSAHGGTHREGLVVQFSPDRGEPWVGNFQPQFGGHLSAVFELPGSADFVVVSGGQAYQVDPEGRRCVEAFGGDFVAAAAGDQVLVLATEIDALVLRVGERWVSGRLAWDGISELRVEGDRLLGFGWDAVNDVVRPIKLDLETHVILKSAY